MTLLEKSHRGDDILDVDSDASLSANRGRHSPAVNLLDLEPDTTTFYAEVVAGLRQSPKTLPCKFFYDQRGSRLFDDICELPEYYPTRTELSIMRDWIVEIGKLIGGNCRLVEYGSGSSIKTHILLDHLKNLASYVPVDISRSHLMDSARRLARDYPNLSIDPVCADYTAEFSLPPERHRMDTPHPAAKTVVYFPGSTIGNFTPAEAESFLRRIALQCGHGGGLLIGVDLKKDPAILHTAYNDALGVTAAFNLNLLTRINRELDGDFQLSTFAHQAFYNIFLGRIEMHLVSKKAQTVRIGGEIASFAEGESIHTECSYKYNLDEFRSLAKKAGFTVKSVWTDPDDLFSVQYLTVV